jgi:hypothetical protein
MFAVSRARHISPSGSPNQSDATRRPLRHGISRHSAQKHARPAHQIASKTIPNIKAKGKSMTMKTTKQTSVEPKTFEEQMSRATRLATDLAMVIVDVLIEKDEHPGVIFPALSLASGHLTAVVKHETVATGQADLRAELKEVPGRIERGEEPKL